MDKPIIDNEQLAKVMTIAWSSQNLRAYNKRLKLYAEQEGKSARWARQFALKRIQEGGRTYSNGTTDPASFGQVGPSQGRR